MGDVLVVCETKCPQSFPKPNNIVFVSKLNQSNLCVCLKYGDHKTSATDAEGDLVRLDETRGALTNTTQNKKHKAVQISSVCYKLQVIPLPNLVDGTNRTAPHHPVFLYQAHCSILKSENAVN